jgi:hypothetical protein
MTTQFGRLLEVLVRADVAFVVIGGVALVTQGGARATFDLDICYARSAANHLHLERALAPFQPRLRGVDPSLPFFFDVRSLRSGLNFALTTSLGDLDLLGDVAGVGGYAEAAVDGDRVEAFGVSFLVLSLAKLEASKRAAGRPKDLLDLAEIAALRDRDR